jgi:molecular chaperone GrpE
MDKHHDKKEEKKAEDNTQVEEPTTAETKVEQEIEALQHKEIARLQEDLTKAKTDADESKKGYLRALADYQNLEKRVRDEKAEFSQVIQANMMSHLIPVLDNLYQAEIFIKDQGLKIVKDQLVNTLAEIGLKEIELMGKEYDPHTAEAIEVVDGEQDNIVVEVIKKGYMLGERVIRAGQVKVSRKNAE